MNGRLYHLFIWSWITLWCVAFVAILLSCEKPEVKELDTHECPVVVHYIDDIEVERTTCYWN